MRHFIDVAIDHDQQITLRSTITLTLDGNEAKGIINSLQRIGEDHEKIIGNSTVIELKLVFPKPQLATVIIHDSLRAGKGALRGFDSEPAALFHSFYAFAATLRKSPNQQELDFSTATA